MRDCLIFMYYDGEIVESVDRAKFQSRNSMSFYVEQHMNFENFRGEIVSRVSSVTQRFVSNITYRFLISVIHQKAEYRAYLLRSDDDLWLLFDCYKRYYPEISTAKIMVDLEEAETREDLKPCEIQLIENNPIDGDYNNSNEDDPDFRCSEEEEEEEEEEEDDDDDDDEDEGEDEVLNFRGIVEGVAQLDDTPVDMFYIDIDAMNVLERPEGSNSAYNPPSLGEELQEGMQFQTKEDVQDSIKYYSVRKFVDYTMVKSNRKKYCVQCKTYGIGCSWGLLALFSEVRGMWRISRYNGPHTYTSRDYTLDHKKSILT